MPKKKAAAVKTAKPSADGKQVPYYRRANGKTPRQVYLSPEEFETISKAAAIKDWSITQTIRLCAVRAAEEIVSKKR